MDQALAQAALERPKLRNKGTALWAPEPARRFFAPEAVVNAGMRHHHLANTAYPIAHRKTIWRYRQPSDRHQDLLAAAFDRLNGPLSLYLHIPFCEKRCSFCEYCVVRRHDEAIESSYHLALMSELELYLELLGRGRAIQGLDIGGGTPSIIEPSRIGQLVDKVQRCFTLEPSFGISIETTPKVAALHPERLSAYRALGIDRISMGLQMINTRLLRDYGRELHEVGFNQRAVDNIRRAGFQGFNIDLIYGLARQSLADFERSLALTIQLDPEYITLYRMRYKGTRIRDEAEQVSLERVVQMYELARRTLTDAGYRAEPGKNGFSRVEGDPGTSAYLTSRVIWSVPYLGLGLGAQTFTNNLLAYNLGAASKRIEAYIAATSAGKLPIQDLYHLPPGEAMAKMIAVSFYFGQIQLEAFRLRFGIDLEQRFPSEVAYLLDEKLMTYDGPRLRLTERGARCFNGVVALFFSDRVKEHLIGLG